MNCIVWLAANCHCILFLRQTVIRFPISINIIDHIFVFNTNTVYKINMLINCIFWIAANWHLVFLRHNVVPIIFSLQNRFDFFYLLRQQPSRGRNLLGDFPFFNCHSGRNALAPRRRLPKSTVLKGAARRLHSLQQSLRKKKLSQMNYLVKYCYTTWKGYNRSSGQGSSNVRSYTHITGSRPWTWLTPAPA